MRALRYFGGSASVKALALGLLAARESTAATGSVLAPRHHTCCVSDPDGYGMRPIVMSISPMASAPDEHVVTAEDLLEGPRAKQWVQVAARVFPELGTVSKAKRARKAGHLLLNEKEIMSVLS
ncbi:hypothetical protein KRP22_012036 [Phytophthora ramorum]|nr:hypothetical protein KRP22_11874 [Phytophthora ramorum]